MGDFSAFIALLLWIARTIVDATTYLIASLLLCVACILPWRWCGIFAEFVHKDSRSFRVFCLGEFAKSAADVVCVPAGFLGALVPSRTYQYFVDSRKIANDAIGSATRWNGDLRVMWFVLFWQAIADMVTFTICAPSLVIPTRLLAFCSSLRHGHHQFRDKGAKNPLLLCPCCFCGNPFDSDDDSDGFDDGLQRINTDVRFVWLWSPLIGIVELLSLVSVFVLFATLLRARQVIVDVRTVMRAGKDIFTDSFKVYGFRVKLHQAILSNAATLVIDIFFVPLLLVLFVTLWRAPPVWRELRRGVDWRTRRCILRQSLKLTLDVLLLLPCVVVVCLAYRSGPVFRAIRTQTPTLLLPITSDAARREDEGIVTAYHRAVVSACFETVVDTPFILAGGCVVCTLYRADLVLKACCEHDTTGPRVRRAVGIQFLRLLRDAVTLLPLLVVVLTLYRLPSLLVNLKAKLSRLLLEEAEMEPITMTIAMPRPRGQPGFRIRASKSPNLSEVTSMRLHIAGDRFWTDVERLKGSLVAAAGQAFFPFPLRDGREVTFSSIAYGRVEADITVQFEKRVQASSIEKFLNRMPQETPLLLQIEATMSGQRRAVLLALPLRVAELNRAMTQSTSCEVSADCLTEDATMVRRRVEDLRGAASRELRRDLWWPLVIAEFVQIVLDFVHLCLLVALVAFPWRLSTALWEGFCEPAARRDVRMAGRTLVGLQVWCLECDRIAAKLGAVTDVYAKTMFCTENVSQDARASCQRRSNGSDDAVASIEQCIGCCCCVFCPCCPNYGPDPDEAPFGRRARNPQDIFEDCLAKLDKRLSLARAHLARARRCWPEGPEWSPMSELVDSELISWTLTFFWLLLLPHIHLLVAQGSITPEEHARLCQTLRIRVLEIKKERGKRSELLKEMSGERRCEAARSGKGRVKTKKLMGAIIREHFIKGITDLLILPTLLLLVLSVYRVSTLRVQLRGPWDAARAKAILKHQVAGLCADAFVLLQVIVLKVLLVVTVVKLPDYLSGLRMTKGLRPIRNWALAKMAELVVGILELLLLLSAWKTYVLIIRATTCAVLTPAAMLGMATPKCLDRRVRFGIITMLWAIFFVGLCWVWTRPGASFDNGASICLMVVWLITLFLAMFGFAGNQVGGWLAPLGGNDWWNPVVRCTLPNLLALATIVVEAITTYYVAFALKTPTAVTFIADAINSDSTITAALVLIGASILLVSLAVTSDEDDQLAVVGASKWRAAMTFTQETLFLPIVLVLSSVKSPRTLLHSAAVYYYITLAVLANGVWDMPVPRSLLLDIRCVGMSSSGRRLLLCAAVLAANVGSELVFVIFSCSACAWALAWAPRGGSVLWVELLRAGSLASCCAVIFFSQKAALFGMAGFALVSTVVAVVDWARRRVAWARSSLPKAIAELEGLTLRLSVWGNDVEAESLVTNLSAQGVAQKVIQLETQIPFDRFTTHFMAGRHAWRSTLLDAACFEEVLGCIQELREGIVEPTTRILLKQVLGRAPLAKGRSIPAPLIDEVLAFAVPQLGFKPLAPVEGWRTGRLGLVQIARDARNQAWRLPEHIGSRGPGRPQVFGRRHVSDHGAPLPLGQEAEMIRLTTASSST